MFLSVIYIKGEREFIAEELMQYLIPFMGAPVEPNSGSIKVGTYYFILRMVAAG